MKLIEILPNVYGVKVPSDFANFAIHNNRLEFFVNEEPTCYFLSQTPKDKFKALGFLTKDEISFDASQLVQSTEIDVEQYDGILMAIPRFWDYELESFSLSSSDESFRSALPKEIYFENEYGNNEPNLEAECCGKWQDNGEGYPICCGYPIPTEESHYLQDLWQTAQSNITEKLLILQKTT